MQMGLLQLLGLLILGLFLFVITLLIKRAWENYKRICEDCSQLPTFKQLSLFTYRRWLKYVSSFGDRLPPLACFYQITCGATKLFSDGFFVVWLFLSPHVLVYKADLIQELIGHSAALDKSYEYDFLRDFFGTGLVGSNGEIWKRHRKLLTPAFHMSILKGYMSIYNEHASIFVEKLKELTAEPWIEIAPFLKACSFDIILEAAIGLKTKCQKGNKEGMMYMESIDELTESLAYRTPRPWMHIDFIFYLLPTGRKLIKNMKIARPIVQKIIQEKKEEFLSTKQVFTENGIEDDTIPNKKTFIEILFNTHFSDENFTSNDIEDEVNTFIVAGYDTLSTALNFLLYLVGLDKDVQENIIQELDSIFQVDSGRMVAHEDLSRMKYLECVIKESLRLCPPFPLMARKLHEDVQVGNYKIPKGCVLVYVIPELHRDPEIFPNPEKFDPDRFSSENSANRNPYSFTPFSAGARNCIGQKFGMMEMKVILAHFFRNFTLESLDPRDKITFSWNMMLRTVQPIRLRIVPRKK